MNAFPIYGVGAYVSPWNTNRPASNPPLFSHSTSFIKLSFGGHVGKISIEHVADSKRTGVSGGNWQMLARLDDVILASHPYGYHGANQSYLEINVDPNGTWTFWGDFGSVSRNAGSTDLSIQSQAEFGCTAGEGDYLMCNSFTNCAINLGGSKGWVAPNFSARTPKADPQFAASLATEDSIMFHDSPTY